MDHQTEHLDTDGEKKWGKREKDGEMISQEVVEPTTQDPRS